MFYDNYLEIYKKSQVTNELFQTIDTYTIDFIIECDVQPSTQEIIRKTFGDDTESLFIIFTDEDLQIGTVVGFDNNRYKINKKVSWDDYNIYSITND